MWADYVWAEDGNEGVEYDRIDDYASSYILYKNSVPLVVS